MDFVSPLDNTPFIYSASSSGAAIAAADNDLEDACSICLEPFNSEDPPTVTDCEHEYHLHCILEWKVTKKQRVPYMLAASCLKGPASQELLAAVENERNLRSRRNAHHIHEDNEMNHDNSYADDSNFDECILQHFAAAARRAHNVHRRGSQRSSGIGPTPLLFSGPTGDLSDVQHMETTSPKECRSSSHEFLEGDSPNSCMLTTINAQTSSSVVPDGMNMEPNSVDNRNGYIKPSQLSPESPRRSSSSNFLHSRILLKSKFSPASSRYKESISKSTRGFKEKLLGRNISVKELGRGVQREMNAGIAGVTRIIEHLDLTSKRNEASAPLSSSAGGTSNFSYKGKCIQQSVITPSPNVNAGETANDMSSAASPYSTIPGHLKVPLAQLKKITWLQLV